MSDAALKKGSYRRLIRNLRKHEEEIAEARKDERRKVWLEAAEMIEREMRLFKAAFPEALSLKDRVASMRACAKIARTKAEEQ